jgi:hypothetical protein
LGYRVRTWQDGSTGRPYIRRISDNPRLQALAPYFTRKRPSYSTKAFKRYWVDRESSLGLFFGTPRRSTRSVSTYRNIINKIYELPEWKDVIESDGSAPPYVYNGPDFTYSRRIANAFSKQARADLIQKLMDSGQLPALDSSTRFYMGTEEGQFTKIIPDVLRGRRADEILTLVLDELPQLATRLLVKNSELYGRYDRLMAEAAFRINVSYHLYCCLVP